MYALQVRLNEFPVQLPDERQGARHGQPGADGTEIPATGSIGHAD